MTFPVIHQVTRINFNDALAPGLKIQQWNTTGTKGLEYSYVNTGSSGGHNSWLSFRGISANFSQKIWYTYTAKYSSNYGEYILADLSDGAGVPIARMRISASGSVSLIGRDWITSRVIGNIPPGAVHSVVFTVNVLESQYNLLIASPGQEAIQVTGERLLATNSLDFHNPANPTISFQLSEYSGERSKYTIESISITRNDISKK